MSEPDRKGTVIVKTRAGQLRGEHERGTVVFRGIRFAQPPPPTKPGAPGQPPIALPGVNAGLFASIRNAYRRSCGTLMSVRPAEGGSPRDYRVSLARRRP